MRTAKIKTPSFISLLALCVLCMPGALLSQEASKTGSFEMTYDVSANALIEFHNKLGDVNIKTWDRDQLSLKVNYSLEVKNAADLDVFIKAIRNPLVENKEERLLVDTRFFESLSTTNNNFKRSTAMKFKNGQSIEIESYVVNYELRLPRNNAFNLNSSYSDIQIDALYANSKLTVYDGNLDLRVSEALVSFDLRYTDLIANELNDCVLKLYDSDVEITETGAIEMDSKYSKVHVKNCEGVKLNSYDDKIYFDNVSGIEGTAKYTTLVTTDLNRVTLDAYDCSLDFGNMTQLDLKSAYSRMAFGNISSRVNLNSYDDKISFRGIAVLEGNSKYTSFTIGNIEDRFKLISYDDNINVNQLKSGFSLIDIETKYTNLELNIEESADYKLSVDSRYTSIVLDQKDYKQVILEKKSEKLLADYIKNGGAATKKSLIKIKSYDGKVEIN
ncbi:MAG: hypothetical protein U5Q03_19190 [Bacteroidota bacterium]|nr:hypothetical protein [Bacteroidota bacterium]